MKCLVDNYSKDALTAITCHSHSMAELAANLGYSTRKGKTYEVIRERLNQYNISTEHFKPPRIHKNITEEEIFCENSTVSQKCLRSAYKRKEAVPYQCNKCGLEGLWNNEELTLQLDHIDGDNHNNVLSNLRWLCPNCHSQTPTFAGRNLISSPSPIKEKCLNYCIDCGAILSSKKAIRCNKCNSLLRAKTSHPSKDDLRSLLIAHNGNFTKVAKLYNVSTSSIRRWCKGYSLDVHSGQYKTLNVKPKKSTLLLPISVKQIDINTGNVIAEFSSISEAEKISGIAHINNVIKGNRKSAGGYYWERK